jgi:FtsP/CotA-like multicopper oxidase with cupredoxin domain
MAACAGPLIDVNVGDWVRIDVTNTLLSRLITVRGLW